MRMLGKLQRFPTDYFNKKKTFLSPLSSLLHASSFLILKKTALSLFSHFVLIPQPQRRCRQEREREEFIEEKKK
jgi:hypothetical protein